MVPWATDCSKAFKASAFLGLLQIKGNQLTAIPGLSGLAQFWMLVSMCRGGITFSFDFTGKKVFAVYADTKSSRRRQQSIHADVRSQIKVIWSFECSTHSFAHDRDSFIKCLFFFFFFQGVSFIELWLKLILTDNFKHNGKRKSLDFMIIQRGFRSRVWWSFFFFFFPPACNQIPEGMSSENLSSNLISVSASFANSLRSCTIILQPT